jgi:hypothetical protein
MADIQCQVDIPKEEGGAGLTVGQIFALNCEGPWPQMKADAVELRLDKENQYKLKLLKVEFLSNTRARLLVTSYKTGEHQLKALQLVEGDRSVVLGDLSFTVNSVMNPQQPVKEPFGPMGPLGLRLPIWYVLGLIFVILMIALVILFRWRVRRQKRKLLNEMRLGEYAQDPLFQFYQTARKMQRGYAFFSGGELTGEDAVSFVSALNQAFKIYLARLFQVPTLAWSERRILADLRKNHPEFYQEFRDELRQALAELSRAIKAGKTMNSKDCQQLFELLRKQVDRIQTWQKARGNK